MNKGFLLVLIFIACVALGTGIPLLLSGQLHINWWLVVGVVFVGGLGLRLLFREPPAESWDDNTVEPPLPGVARFISDKITRIDVKGGKTFLVYDFGENDMGLQEIHRRSGERIGSLLRGTKKDMADGIRRRMGR